MENKLKVSVIIPNYNYAKYLKKRVKLIEKEKNGMNWYLSFKK